MFAPPCVNLAPLKITKLIFKHFLPVLPLTLLALCPPSSRLPPLCKISAYSPESLSPGNTTLADLLFIYKLVFLLSFLQCFTSIVGPNGSGKSNVIDSMLFVFGYRAKQIRSKKVSVLIHNSELHMNIQSCTVSVHFQKIVDLVRAFVFRTN